MPALIQPIRSSEHEQQRVFVGHVPARRREMAARFEQDGSF